MIAEAEPTLKTRTLPPKTESTQIAKCPWSKIRRRKRNKKRKNADFIRFYSRSSRSLFITKIDLKGPSTHLINDKSAYNH